MAGYTVGVKAGRFAEDSWRVAAAVVDAGWDLADKASSPMGKMVK